MSANDIVVTGIAALRHTPGQACSAEAAVLPWLKNPKSRKFMGKQDELAVASAGLVLRAAGLLAHAARHDAGLYLAVGHIPFERKDIEAIASHSRRASGQGGASGEDPTDSFDIDAFARVGIEQVNPLLTFRCLPNMPAFHVSLNFELRGPYFITYPGVAQAYEALRQAVDDLNDGLIDHALVGGVADQHNFLVNFFFERDARRRSLPREDGASFFCLERASTAEKRGTPVLARLLQHQAGLAQGQDTPAPCAPHAAALGLWLAHSLRAKTEAGGAGAMTTVAEHRARSLDGFDVCSRWELS